MGVMLFTRVSHILPEGLSRFLLQNQRQQRWWALILFFLLAFLVGKALFPRHGFATGTQHDLRGAAGAGSGRMGRDAHSGEDGGAMAPGFGQQQPAGMAEQDFSLNFAGDGAGGPADSTTTFASAQVAMAARGLQMSSTLLAHGPGNARVYTSSVSSNPSEAAGNQLQVGGWQQWAWNKVFGNLNQLVKGSAGEEGVDHMEAQQGQDAATAAHVEGGGGGGVGQGGGEGAGTGPGEGAASAAVPPQRPTTLLAQGDPNANGATRNYKGLRLLFVMWIGSSVTERMMAIESTWARNLPPGVNLMYFTTPPDYELMKSIPFRFPIVVLDSAVASYPPQSLMMESIRYIGRDLAQHYDCIMRVDSDNFINVPALLGLLQHLDPSDHHYFGMPGKGRQDVIAKLGLPKEYCLGGSGVIMSRSVLQAMSPRVDECIRAIRTPHEDTELGRCVWITTNTHCHIKTTKKLDLRSMFYNIYFTVMNARGMLAAPGLPENINSVAIEAIVLHPVRRFKEFVMLQRFQEHALRPLQTLEQPYTNEKHIFRTACVHSWVAQSMLMCEGMSVFTKACKWRLMRECDSPVPDTAEAYAAVASKWQVDFHIYHYIAAGPTPSQLALGSQTGSSTNAVAGDQPEADTAGEGSLAQHSLTCLNKELARSGVSADAMPLPVDISQPVQSPPESGGAIHPPATQEMASLRAIIKEAMYRNAPRIMVFQGSELRFVEDFSSKLQVLLEKPRCAGHLYTASKGGVLILSPSVTPPPPATTSSSAAGQAGVGAGAVSAEWFKKLPSLLGEDQKRTGGSPCFNVPLNMTTSAAAIFHKNTFPVIARYIDNLPADKTSLSDLFNHLIMEGFIVRAAAVPLVVAAGDPASGAAVTPTLAAAAARKDKTMVPSCSCGQCS